MTKTCSKCSMNKPHSAFKLFRRSSDGLAAWCIVCHATASREHYLQNKAARNETARAWAAANPEKARKASNDYHHRNKADRAQRAKEWGERNKDLRRATTAKRKAALLMATPAWADMAAIADVYKLAVRVQKESGIRMHVDHVVPLQSKYVCGLHIAANLRVLPGAENESKKNRFWPDMPTIERAYAQGKLFAPEIVKPEQGALV